MKEVADYLEREYKFDPTGIDNDEAIVEMVRGAIPADTSLEMRAPRTIIDLYLDDEELTLLRTDWTFRLRKRRIRPSWTANAKPPRNPDTPYVERREIRTSLSVAEALQHTDGQMPGEAAHVVYRHISAVNDVPVNDVRIESSLYIVSRRRSYALVPSSFPENGDRTWSTFPLSGFLYLIFDDVTAFDVRRRDTAMLVSAGLLPYDSPLLSTTFTSLEMEVGAGQYEIPGLADTSLSLMRTVGEAITNSGFRPIHESKYRQAASLLSLSGLDDS